MKAIAAQTIGEIYETDLATFEDRVAEKRWDEPAVSRANRI